MKVSDILKDKGSAVMAVKASDSILELARKMKTDAVGAMDKMALTLESDGTWKMSGVPGEEEVSGTYTVEGTTFTLTPTKGAKGDQSAEKVEYNEKDQTLTLKMAGQNQPLTMKKK